MKAAEFDYVRATSIDEVCDLLDDSGEHKIIAGGQTLVPLMAMRLARPSLLIDIADIAALRGIRVDGDRLCIGAATRQVDAERSTLVRTRLPLLAQALRWVGHPQTRNRCVDLGGRGGRAQQDGRNRAAADRLLSRPDDDRVGA